jgi:hypothetical protein
MTVAFDAITSFSATAGDISETHTPVGTPKGVIVFVGIGSLNGAGGDSDNVVGVTYGGETMTRIDFQAQDGGEDISEYCY